MNLVNMRCIRRRRQPISARGNVLNSSRLLPHCMFAVRCKTTRLRHSSLQTVEDLEKQVNEWLTVIRRSRRSTYAKRIWRRRNGTVYHHQYSLQEDRRPALAFATGQFDGPLRHASAKRETKKPVNGNLKADRRHTCSESVQASS